MEKQNETVLGIALLFTLITGTFSVLSKLNMIFLSDNIITGLSQFFFRYMLSIVVIAGILIILFVLNNKKNQNLLTILNDRIMRFTTAILIIIYGLINLSSALPLQIISIKSFIVASKYIQSNQNIDITRKIIIDVISMILIICQIIIGIYLAKLNKNKEF